MDASEQIEKFQDFFEISYKKELPELVRKGRKSLIVDFSNLIKFDPDLAELLLQEPEEVMKAAEMALEQFDLGVSLRVRFNNLPLSQMVFIRDIRSSHIDSLIFFEGTVRQSSDVRPQVINAKFECPACGNVINITQLESKFKEPSRCSCGRRGKFRLLGKELVDAQRLIIEESSEDLEGGSQPKRLSVFLREDLVEPVMEKKTTPGNKVKVIGVVKEIPILLPGGGISTRFDLIMNCNYIEPVQEEFSNVEINLKDEEEILKLSNDPKIYEKFKRSIAPSIYGHDKVKEALVLQLMGGVRKVKEDGTVTRGDMHMLLVGDPGSGKSALLTFIAKAAPKARYIAGKGVSAAGITASVVRDEFLRGWALEAGALVLANKGIAVLDEMDKMSVEDTSALHEAMEQQTITIAKANIQATLMSQTTVLAAANPKFGRFNPYNPIAEQIDLPPALINRFDLIFTIRDMPDRMKDAKIAQHVLGSVPGMSFEPEIPLSLFRKYIAYAKQRIFPKMTESAMEEVKNFYVELRNTETSGDAVLKPIPISARQLEALVRLSEGSARIRLSNKVTRKDARKAIELLKSCLMEVGIDPETGQIDIDRISTGITASTRNKILIIRDLIVEMEEKSGKKVIKMEDLIAEADDKNIDERSLRDIIEKLKKEGEVFEPKSGSIQRI